MDEIGARIHVSQKWLRQAGLWAEAKRVAGVNDGTQIVIVMLKSEFSDKMLDRAREQKEGKK